MQGLGNPQTRKETPDKLKANNRPAQKAGRTEDSQALEEEETDRNKPRMPRVHGNPTRLKEHSKQPESYGTPVTPSPIPSPPGKADLPTTWRSTSPGSKARETATLGDRATTYTDSNVTSGVAYI